MLLLAQERNDDSTSPEDTPEESKPLSEPRPERIRSWADEQLNPYNGFPAYGEFDHYSY